MVFQDDAQKLIVSPVDSVEKCTVFGFIHLLSIANNPPPPLLIPMAAGVMLSVPAFLPAYQWRSRMKTMTIELRAAEGGADARLFAAELAQSYLRLAIAKG